MKFPKDELEFGEEMDATEREFNKYKRMDLPDSVVSAERVDVAWGVMSNLKDPVTDSVMLPRLCRIMKLIVTLPHSNADVERIFSIVRKNQTDFRPNLGLSTLNHIVQLKVNDLNDSEVPFYDFNPSAKFLRRAKKATHEGLNSKTSAQPGSSK